jgi:hypothetical protein
LVGGRKEKAELGPLAADDIFGLRACRAAIIVERGQILEVEKAARRRIFELKIEKARVEAALYRMNAAARTERLVMAIERIEIAGHEREPCRHAGREARDEAEIGKRPRAGLHRDDMYAEPARNANTGDLAKRGLHRPGDGLAGPCCGAKRNPALAGSANDQPEGLAENAHLGGEFARGEGRQRLAAHASERVAERKEIGGDRRGAVLKRARFHAGRFLLDVSFLPILFPFKARQGQMFPAVDRG